MQDNVYYQLILQKFNALRFYKDFNDTIHKDE